jgi:hypothetical protein
MAVPGAAGQISMMNEVIENGSIVESLATPTAIITESGS